MTAQDKDVILKVSGLKKYFPVRQGMLGKKKLVKAVDDLSIVIREGQTVGLVGESGCGKTTASRSIVKLLQPTAGSILFKPKGADADEKSMIELAGLSKKEMKPIRRDMSMIFQDPMNSLNPRMSVYDIITEPLKIQGLIDTGTKDYIAELLVKVGLRAEHMVRYPHEFSGGQRQRIGIARALSLKPRLILCDEPVSALDVSIQAQTLNLLQDLQEEFNLAYLFVAHDLSVVHHISHSIAVMYAGRIVELGKSEELFAHPKHPYTEALMAAVPIPDPDVKKAPSMMQGDIPDPSNLPSGCYFHPRCRYAKDICRKEYPVARESADGRCVSCHFSDTMSLKGIE